MKNERIIPGVVLIMIGAVILLNNYGYIDFHWGNFIYLLPIFIVIGGVNLIFGHNNRSAAATAIKLFVLAGGFALILFGNFGKNHGIWNYAYTFDNDHDDDDSGKSVVKVSGNSVFNEAYSADTKVARLNISGGGTIYTLNDTTSELFNANTKEFNGRYEFKKTKTDSLFVLDFNMRGHRHGHVTWHNNNKTNEVLFKLNPNPEWELNVETGATKLDFDLAKFKVRSLKISGGAASFNIKMGQPLATTNIDVETGVSEVNISVPQTAACHIKTDSGLSSNKFDGFVKTGDNTYETPGFAKATNKMYLKLDGGVSDFKVKRY